MLSPAAMSVKHGFFPSYAPYPWNTLLLEMLIVAHLTNNSHDCYGKLMVC
jgi:hypothetical protein